jgi:hypothetical protein
MLSKTRDYLDHFARFKRKENVEAVERLLSAHKELAKFERAQLGSYSLLHQNTKQMRMALERELKQKREEGDELVLIGKGMALHWTKANLKNRFPML